MADITSDIETNAQGPKSMTVDGNSATQHDLKDQMEYQDWADARAARNKTKLPIRFAKIKPDGTL